MSLDTNNVRQGGCGSGQCACKSAAQARALDPFDDTDYGTPQRHADTDVTLEIDGQPVTVPAGTSVMRAAIEAGVNVPKLCATDSLEPFGSCRQPRRNRRPARLSGVVHDTCGSGHEGAHAVGPAAVAAAQRDGAVHLRPPARLPHLPANGDCELQDMAGVVGLREVRYGFDGANHLRDKKDESNPYFTYDPSKCIVCNRCVRACEETQGTFALTIAARGFESRVAAGESESFMASECVSCGACVAACPTATLQEKSVVQLGQAEHSVVTTCAYCGVGCSFKAEMKARRSCA